METLRENIQTQNNVLETEAQKHNAMISERYNRLQNTVYEQLSASATTVEPVRAATVAPEKPVTHSNFNYASLFAQAPAVTEFVRYQEPVQELTPIAPPVEEIAPVQTASAVREEYTLSSVAKMALAAFSVVVVAMFSLIGVNTGIIKQKQIQLQNLQARKQELMETNTEIQRRIENATSEDAIREYAQSQGYIG